MVPPKLFMWCVCVCVSNSVSTEVRGQVAQVLRIKLRSLDSAIDGFKHRVILLNFHTKLMDEGGLLYIPML